MARGSSSNGLWSVKLAAAAMRASQVGGYRRFEDFEYAQWLVRCHAGAAALTDRRQEYASLPKLGVVRQRGPTWRRVCAMLPLPARADAVKFADVSA